MCCDLQYVTVIEGFIFYGWNEVVAHRTGTAIYRSRPRWENTFSACESLFVMSSCESLLSSSASFKIMEVSLLWLLSFINTIVVIKGHYCYVHHNYQSLIIFKQILTLCIMRNVACMVLEVARQSWNTPYYFLVVSLFTHHVLKP